MRKLKNEKGITLIALVITVAVLSMISVPVLVNMTNISQFNTYTEFKDDIDVLRESISSAYYNKFIGTIGPKYDGDKSFLTKTQNGKNVKNNNDNEVYYAINVNLVNKNLPANMNDLNNGEGNKNLSESKQTYSSTDNDDVYIINEQSRTIYYVKGVNYKGQTYYRLNEDFSTTDIGVSAGIKVEGFNKTFTDKYGFKAKIPVGYKVSSKPEEQIVSKGLVITDDNGNEFVWIPVQDFKTEEGKSVSVVFDRYKYGTQSTTTAKDIDSDSLKISNSGDTSNYFYELKDSFEASSAIQNGGYYIARYESGTSTSRTAGTSTTETMNIKGSLNIYNFVSESEAKTLAENFAGSSNTNFKSKLCSSYAWDTALQFIEKTLGSSNVTTSTTATTTTGVSSSLNNIYDLNNYQWTTELYSNSSKQYTARGGNSPSARTSQETSKKDSTIGFRVALFLNI